MEQTITQSQPGWLEETPECDYCLTMYGPDGSVPEQDVSLTRREFEALKHELAVRRGYIVEDVAQEPAEKIVSEAKRHGSKIAAQSLIDDAREAFELFIADGSAEDIHVLQQALAFGATGGSIVKSFR